MRPTDTAPLTESEIWAALRDCYHPQLRANVVELGLIHSVDVTFDPAAPGSRIPGVPARYRVRVRLMSSAADSRDDDGAAQNVPLIENRLAALPSISRTEIELIHDPPWTPDRIAPELRARAALGIASNHRPDDLVQIQTNPVATRKGS
jgi:metal-sulfur cluster biosynthetic enzyme